MSDTSIEKAPSLPSISVANLDMISECLKAGQQAVIYRHATMERPHALEVIAFCPIIDDIGRLSLTGMFDFTASTDPIRINRLREGFFGAIRELPLGSHGITSRYANGARQSVRLGLEDGKTSVTTWFSKPGDSPHRLYVANNHRDGQNGKISSLAPRFNRETVEQDIASYMKLLSVVDRVLGDKSTSYGIDFVERRSISRRAANRSARSAKADKAEAKNKQNTTSKAETEAAALDTTYQPRLPNPDARLSEVHGINPKDREKLEERILAFKHPELAKQWEVQSGGGILFYGPAGTGKTMAATALANETGGRLWQIDGADIVDKWVGGSTANVNALFGNAVEVAKLGPLTLLFDEVDTIITSGDNQSTERTAAMGEFKRQLGYVASSVPNILVVATTNHPEKLDIAFKRSGRFDLSVYMPAPDDRTRLGILMEHITVEESQNQRTFGGSADMHFEKLAAATKNMTGADIALIIKNCRLQKFRTHAKQGIHPGSITHEDIIGPNS